MSAVLKFSATGQLLAEQPCASQVGSVYELRAMLFHRQAECGKDSDGADGHYTAATATVASMTARCVFQLGVPSFCRGSIRY